ncbi:MAG: addiction module protein [Pseudomonadota bacterium]
MDQILDEALSLEERSELAVALLESLENANPVAVSEAWKAEVKRRRDGWRAGNVRATPWAGSKATLSLAVTL